MIEEKVIQEWISPLLEEMNYTLISIKKSVAKNEVTLQIVVDKEEPISIDDIVEVSEKIGELLDEKDVGDTSYTLDVSSLGIEKPIALSSLKKKVGAYVHLTLKEPYKGYQELEGSLEEAAQEDVIAIKVNFKGQIKIVSIPLSHIEGARYAVKF